MFDLLMALKKVTELQLLWSIETILSVFDYLIQQESVAVVVLLYRNKIGLYYFVLLGFINGTPAFMLFSISLLCQS